MGSSFIVAIDGPAASGKSSVARRLAERLGACMLDTGSVYRALAWLALRERTDPDDGESLARLAARLATVPRVLPGHRLREVRVLADGVDVTDLLDSEAVERIVSRVSAHPVVRAALLPLQREAVRGEVGVVAGRDIGTKVFPDAAVKIYLLASPVERARRRAAQRGVAEPAEVDQVLAAILQRDRRDAGQMAPAPDAVPIDTDGRTIDEVVDQIGQLVRVRTGGGHPPG